MKVCIAALFAILQNWKYPISEWINWDIHTMDLLPSIKKELIIDNTTDEPQNRLCEISQTKKCHHILWFDSCKINVILSKINSIYVKWKLMHNDRKISACAENEKNEDFLRWWMFFILVWWFIGINMLELIVCFKWVAYCKPFVKESPPFMEV
jgi:hypothetical protein